MLKGAIFHGTLKVMMHLTCRREEALNAGRSSRAPQPLTGHVRKMRKALFSLCICKTEEQQRPQQRSDKRTECDSVCPKFAWQRDPGWPEAPTIADAPVIGARFSYLPSSGKDGTIEYCGCGEWSSVS